MNTYRNKLEALVAMRDFNRDVLNHYGYVMDDMGKSYHTSKAQYFDDQIIRALPMVLDEMLEEIIRQFDIKVQDEATAALRQLREELRRLGK